MIEDNVGDELDELQEAVLRRKPIVGNATAGANLDSADSSSMVSSSLNDESEEKYEHDSNLQICLEILDHVLSLSVKEARPPYCEPSEDSGLATAKPDQAKPIPAETTDDLVKTGEGSSKAICHAEAELDKLLELDVDDISETATAFVPSNQEEFLQGGKLNASQTLQSPSKIENSDSSGKDPLDLDDNDFVKSTSHSPPPPSLGGSDVEVSKSAGGNLTAAKVWVKSTAALMSSRDDNCDTSGLVCEEELGGTDASDDDCQKQRVLELPAVDFNFMMDEMNDEEVILVDGLSTRGSPPTTNSVSSSVKEKSGNDDSSEILVIRESQNKGQSDMIATRGEKRKGGLLEKLLTDSTSVPQPLLNEVSVINPVTESPQEESSEIIVDSVFSLNPDLVSGSQQQLSGGTGPQPTSHTKKPSTKIRLHFKQIILLRCLYEGKKHFSMAAFFEEGTFLFNPNNVTKFLAFSRFSLEMPAVLEHCNLQRKSYDYIVFSLNGELIKAYKPGQADESIHLVHQGQFLFFQQEALTKVNNFCRRQKGHSWIIESYFYGRLMPSQNQDTSLILSVCKDPKLLKNESDPKDLSFIFKLFAQNSAKTRQGKKKKGTESDQPVDSTGHGPAQSQPQIWSENKSLRNRYPRFHESSIELITRCINSKCSQQFSNLSANLFHMKNFCKSYTTQQEQTAFVSMLMKKIAISCSAPDCNLQFNVLKDFLIHCDKSHIVHSRVYSCYLCGIVFLTPFFFFGHSCLVKLPIYPRSTSNIPKREYESLPSNVVRLISTCSSCSLQFQFSHALISHIMVRRECFEFYKAKSLKRKNLKLIIDLPGIQLRKPLVPVNVQCNICGMNLPNQLSYLMHMDHHFQGSVYKCSRCQLVVKTLCQFYNHDCSKCAHSHCVFCEAFKVDRQVIPLASSPPDAAGNDKDAISLDPARSQLENQPTTSSMQGIAVSGQVNMAAASQGHQSLQVAAGVPEQRLPPPYAAAIPRQKPVHLNSRHPSSFTAVATVGSTLAAVGSIVDTPNNIHSQQSGIPTQTITEPRAFQDPIATNPILSQMLRPIQPRPPPSYQQPPPRLAVKDFAKISPPRPPRQQLPLARPPVVSLTQASLRVGGWVNRLGRQSRKHHTEGRKLAMLPGNALTGQLQGIMPKTRGRMASPASNSHSVGNQANRWGRLARQHQTENSMLSMPPGTASSKKLSKSALNNFDRMASQAASSSSNDHISVSQPPAHDPMFAVQLAPINPPPPPSSEASAPIAAMRGAFQPSATSTSQHTGMSSSILGSATQPPKGPLYGMQDSRESFPEVIIPPKYLDIPTLPEPTSVPEATASPELPMSHLEPQAEPRLNHADRRQASVAAERRQVSVAAECRKASVAAAKRPASSSVSSPPAKMPRIDIDRMFDDSDSDDDDSSEEDVTPVKKVPPLIIKLPKESVTSSITESESVTNKAPDSEDQEIAREQMESSPITVSPEPNEIDSQNLRIQAGEEIKESEDDASPAKVNGSLSTSVNGASDLASKETVAISSETSDSVAGANSEVEKELDDDLNQEALSDEAIEISDDEEISQDNTKDISANEENVVSTPKTPSPSPGREEEEASGECHQACLEKCSSSCTTVMTREELEDCFLCLNCSSMKILRFSNDLVEHCSETGHEDIKPVWYYNQCQVYLEKIKIENPSIK